MTDKVQKIREEVEKLKSQLLRGACSSQIAMETNCKEEAYNEVLSILDTMQKEPVSEELEEASKNYALNNTPWDDCKDEIQESFKAGAGWKKEQMMASGTDVTVHVDAGNYPYIPRIELYDYDIDIPFAKKGDRYKVILIKKD